VIAAPPAVAWESLLGTVSSSFGGGFGRRFARLLGCAEPVATGDPATPGSTVVGFRVAEADPPRRLILEGRHRFSRYSLAFELEPREGETRLAATTRATFPGLHGRAYRTLVIGSRAHVLVTRRLLDGIRRRAERTRPDSRTGA